MVGRFLRSLSRGGGGSDRSGRSASKSRVSRLQQQQQSEVTVEKRSTSVPPRRKAEDRPDAVTEAVLYSLPRQAGEAAKLWECRGRTTHKISIVQNLAIP